MSVAGSMWNASRAHRDDEALPASTDDEWSGATCVSSGAGIGIFAAALTVLFTITLALFRRQVRRSRAREVKELKRRQGHVQRLCESASVLGFPMCCVSYLDFRDKGRLMTHEEARAGQMLLHFDTLPDGAPALAE